MLRFLNQNIPQPACSDWGHPLWIGLLVSSDYLKIALIWPATFTFFTRPAVGWLLQINNRCLHLSLNLSLSWCSEHQLDQFPRQPSQQVCQHGNFLWHQPILKNITIQFTYHCWWLKEGNICLYVYKATLVS